MKGKQPTFYRSQESQVIAVDQNRDNMNNCSQETSFVLCNYHIFLVKHAHTLITWLQKPTFLQDECISSFYCYDAEYSPSVGDATRRRMKQTFENTWKPLFRYLVVHQIAWKKHRILPFF